MSDSLPKIATRITTTMIATIPPLPIPPPPPEPDAPASVSTAEPELLLPLSESLPDDVPIVLATPTGAGCVDVACASEEVGTFEYEDTDCVVVGLFEGVASGD